MGSSAGSTNEGVGELDFVWIDFGAGPRLSEFFDLIWDRVLPGALVLVHSTLTNQLTRTWLEGMRSRAAEQQSQAQLPNHRHDMQHQNGNNGGIDCPFATLSLLEPHKMFQNSFSIFQKRSDGFSEPVLTKFP